MIEKDITPTPDVGIIVGRFQVHELHEAHRDLIESVMKRHDRVIIFLGLSRLRNTKRNPLDFNSRKQMINELYRDVEVHYINDEPTNETWSKSLDSQIKKWLSPEQTALLYGSRDSFISHYKGKHATCELEPEVYISGTQLRKTISSKTMGNKNFRAGVIWASNNRFNISYTTVDIAVFDEEKKRILLGTKMEDAGKYRFIGGFSDVGSASLEDDARREVYEEASIEISNPKYLCSLQVKDWRYRSEADQIKTTLWTATHLFGSPQAGDDLDGLKWFELSEGLDKLREQMIVAHQPLIEKIFEDLEQ